MNTADGRTDFDFLIGEWTVHNRRLTARLAGSTDWEEFFSSCRAWPILDGLGNQDEFILELPTGRVIATTVRLFNPAAREWSLYWASSATPGRFDPPLVGRFDGPRGEFYGQEVFAGRHVLCHFIWTVDGPEACRWEQAYSEDGGRSWETNWIMAFTRTRD